MMLSCRQTSPSRKLAVGAQARELGAGAGAAGRAVVGLAGAKHEVLAVGARHAGWPEELDMVDLGPVGARDSLPRSGPGESARSTSVSRSTLATLKVSP